jgi:hypothetical protein
MVNEYQYKLKTGSKKHLCPKCGKKRFVRYINSITGDYLPERYGRCDREINCAYHLNPYKDGYAKMNHEQEQNNKFGNWNLMKPVPNSKPISFIPVELLKHSRTKYYQNNFIKWLTTLFDSDTIIEVINSYYIGTATLWSGATIFWQIDGQGNVRTGKIMLYNPDTGKRVKVPYDHISWVHKSLKQPEFTLSQCFFGEHLIRVNPVKPIAIVESEKTAIIASVYLPQFNWLATGGIGNLSIDKCKALKGKNVFLFPDLNGYDKWNRKAKELANHGHFIISDLLEANASEIERMQGLDIADYLVQFDWRSFRAQGDTNQQFSKSDPTPINEKGENCALLRTKYFAKPTDCSLLEKKMSNKGETNAIWSIGKLEKYHLNPPIFSGPTTLDSYYPSLDLSLVVDSEIDTMEVSGCNKYYMPNFERLNQLKSLLTLNRN